MKGWIIGGVVVIAILVFGGMLLIRSRQPQPPQFQQSLEIASPSNQLPLTNLGNMKLTSPVFEHNGSIPAKYTCDGEDINPPLQVSDVPESAQSLVLVMDDPDVPESVRADRMWVHWVVYDIPPDTTDIPEGKRPPGIEGQGTSGDLGYHGPCPPDREHRYFFKLYALDTMLDLSEGVSKAEVEQAMQGHVLDHAELIGRYERNR